MKQPKTFLLLSVVVAVLVLGIAYAAIQNVTFNVNGTASATADASNFKVEFSGTPYFAGTGTITANSKGQDAQFTVSGLTTVGQISQIYFRIENLSTDISAVLSSPVITVNGDTEFFEVKSYYSSDYGTTLAPEEWANLYIQVKLMQSPIDDVSITVDIEFEAAPVYNS